MKKILFLLCLLVTLSSCYSTKGLHSSKGNKFIKEHKREIKKRDSRNHTNVWN